MNLIGASALATLMLIPSVNAMAQEPPAGPDRHPAVNSRPPSPSSQPVPASAPNSEQPGIPANKSQQTCQQGYIVGIFPARDGWDDWLIWVSSTGPSWTYGDAKEYKFYSHATTDYNSGRIIYATALQAMATGQKVAVLDWNGYCSTGYAESIQVWYP